MEAATQEKIQTVLDHHFSAFLEADVNEILKDFTEESEVLTPDGVFKGLNAIHSFFEEVIRIIPKGSALQLKRMEVRDEIAYLTWSCESTVATIPMGTDTFIVNNGKIIYHTLAAHIIPK